MSSLTNPCDLGNSSIGGIKQAEEFERCYREAHNNVDKAITLVTENKHSQAKPLFEVGLKFLDKAIEANAHSLSSDEEVVKHYIKLQDKMKITRKEVLYNFTNSQLSSGALGAAGYPTTAGYDATSNQYPSLPNAELTPAVQLPPPTAPPRKNSGASAQLNLPPDAIGSVSTTPVMSPQEGQLIFKLDSGVQIFFIYPDGRVTSPSYPSFLAIITFDDPLKVPSNTEGGCPRGFLQVGEWSYPLMTQSSPVLHSFYGAYMFPDPNNSVPGSHVGIIIPDSVPKDERDLFEAVLTQLTCYKEQTEVPLKEGEAVAEYSPEEVKSAAEKISSGLVTGAEKLSSGIVWGSEKLSDLMAHLSGRLQETSPAAGSTGAPAPTHINPAWQSTAKAARYASGKAVRVSSYILGQVGKATLYLGRSVAPHIHHHGTKAISNLTGQSSENASSQVDGVLEVAAGAVRGASTVYMGLEKAAETLAVSLTQNTVKVVTHKYGSDAGKLTDNTMYAVGQSAMAGHNVASLGVKGVAKKAAKDTGKALVLNHKENKKGLVGGDVEEGMEIGEDVQVVEQGVEAMDTNRGKGKSKLKK